MTSKLLNATAPLCPITGEGWYMMRCGGWVWAERDVYRGSWTKGGAFYSNAEPHAFDIIARATPEQAEKLEKGEVP